MMVLSHHMANFHVTVDKAKKRELQAVLALRGSDLSKWTRKMIDKFLDHGNV